MRTQAARCSHAGIRDLLNEMLASLGFRDYAAFMQAALTTEMSLRQQHIANGTASKSTAHFNANHHAAISTSIDGSRWRRLEQLRSLRVHCSQLDSSLQELFACLDAFRNMNVMLLDKSQTMLQKR